MSGHPIPDAALDSDIAILGRKGGGKTITAKGIVERLLTKGRRVMVLDPLGVWAGLRTSADGKAAGFPIAIFGGAHADMPLETSAAAAIAGILARENLPAVIDLSDLSKTAQNSFLHRFLHELRRVNTEALTIVLEEADVFAPQNPMGDDSKALHGEIDWIARRGRSRGFRLITITQRPARLSKDVLTQAATLIVHKLPAPQDRDAVKAWVEGNGDRDQARKVVDSLAGLETGQAWVWAPDHGILDIFRFPMIATLDTSATPKAGETKIVAKTLAQVDVSAIRQALQVVLVEKKAAGGAGARPARADEIAAAEKRGYDRGYAEGRERGERWARSALAKAAPLLKEALRLVELELPGKESPASRPGQCVAKLAHAPRQRETARAAPTKSLGAERRILAVLAGTYPAGMTEAQWAVAAGLKRTGGTWSTYLSRLRTSGRIGRRDGIWFATTAGMEDVGEAAAPMPAPGPELVEFWISRIAGVGPMLRHLSGIWPGKIQRQELAAELGLAATGGTFGTYLSRLRSAGLIDEDGQTIAAARSLMSPAALSRAQGDRP
jgi:uncharacterized protein (UPF0335 family)